jgi:cytochrome c-type biogenesis protein
MDISFIISAFIAGVIMFLAPCTLPMVAPYLAFISGVPAEELKNPLTKKAARKKVFLNGVFFILGFSILFVLLGTLVGFIGQELAVFRVWMARISGVILILFGLLMTGVIKNSFFLKERRLKLPSFLTLGKPTTSLIVGGAFGFGWTPCVGPILGAILLLAGNSANVLQGSLLLAVFSLGMAVPFLAVAAGFSSFIGEIGKYLKIIQIIGGVFLILLGTLMLTGNFSLLIAYGYRIFNFIEYDRLLDYL